MPGARAIAPAEVRAAVWHSLIAGARGVIYFNHSFGGPCLSHHVLRDVGCYAAVREMVKSVNAQIKTLAPVLNAPTVEGWTTTPSVRAMVKWYDGRFFVFAGSTNNVAQHRCVFHAMRRRRDGGQARRVGSRARDERSAV